MSGLPAAVYPSAGPCAVVSSEVEDLSERVFSLYAAVAEAGRGVSLRARKDLQVTCSRAAAGLAARGDCRNG